MKNTAYLKCTALSFCLVMTVLLPAALSFSLEIKDAGSDRYCLDCHSRKSALKKFGDGSMISTFVDPRAFHNSVHGSFSCSVCHPEFSEKAHPDRLFRSKQQYRVMESRKCRDCHADTVIKKRKIHETLLNREKEGEAVICANCHSAHVIARVGSGMVEATEEKYCMNCHVRDGYKRFINGEKVSTLVKPEEIVRSPHKDIGCSDCHAGFSSSEHPDRKFGSEREYRHASTEMCRRCHYDKYSQVSENIHYAMLNVGRLDAPTCVDCHGIHAISSPAQNRLSIVRQCASCHRNIYEVYARSVHGAALVDENNRDVAICSDCHSSHSMQATTSNAFHDEIPDRCSNCHANQLIMGKYGLSTDVVKTYLSDFHGMTLSLYRKESWRHYGPPPAMAVCTDCHGTHDIGRMSGRDIHQMKSKLFKRCASCHPGASENFPDAWLSHYRPSFTVAPMVFLTERFYGIMLPVTITGILFLILLDIWRYYKNR